MLDRASAVGDNPGLAAEVEGARTALAGVAAHIASGATATATTAGAVPPAANSPPVPSLSLFSRTTDLPDHEIGLEAITLPKNKRGIEGTKQGSIDRERAITPLEGKFDLMSHQTKYSTGGAATDRSMDQSIKVQIVNLLQLIRRGSDHAINYDLHEITEIGVLVSPSTTPASPTSCSTWWSLTESSGNLWDAWETMDENTVLCHQFSLNKRGGKEEQRSNRWLGTFLKASCSAAMCDKLETKISKLPVSQQGAVIYLYYLLNEMFHMTREVKKAVLECLEDFSKKGATTYSGENWYDVQENIVGLLTRLSVINALDDDVVIQVYEGLTHTTHPELKRINDTLFTFAKLDNFSLVKELTPTSTNLEKCTAVFDMTVDFYEAQCKLKKWNVPIKGGGRGLVNNAVTVPNCWNCRKDGHKLPDCPEPKDQAKIAESKKKWKEKMNEARKKKSGSDKSGSDKQQDGRKITKQRDYKRTQFGAHASGSGIVMVNGEPFISCNVCGLTNTHGSKHHNQAMSDPNFVLAANHPLSIAKAKVAQARAATSGVPPTAGVPPAVIVPPPGAGSICGSVGGASLISRDVLHSRVTQMERASTDPNTAGMCSIIRELLLKE